MVLIALLGSVVAAQWLLNRTVQVSVIIEGNYDFNVFKEVGCITPLTALDFGVMEKGTNTNLECWIKNTGEDPVYVKWDCTEPSGLILAIYYRLGDVSKLWAKNSYILLEKNTAYHVYSIGLSVDLQIVAGTYSFDLVFNGETSEGS